MLSPISQIQKLRVKREKIFERKENLDLIRVKTLRASERNTGIRCE